MVINGNTEPNPAPQGFLWWKEEVIPMRHIVAIAVGDLHREGKPTMGSFFNLANVHRVEASHSGIALSTRRENHGPFMPRQHVHSHVVDCDANPARSPNAQPSASTAPRLWLALAT